MIPDTGSGEPYIRYATHGDIPVLAIHHRKMFEEIREKSGTLVEPSVSRALEAGYAEKLNDDFRTGACIAWVMIAEDRIVSSAAITAGTVLVVIGGIRIRRWWIQRQNPALFREYD